jgi:hypothetical protein
MCHLNLRDQEPLGENPTRAPGAGGALTAGPDRQAAGAPAALHTSVADPLTLIPKLPSGSLPGHKDGGLRDTDPSDVVHSVLVAIQFVSAWPH